MKKMQFRKLTGVLLCSLFLPSVALASEPTHMDIITVDNSNNQKIILESIDKILLNDYDINVIYNDGREESLMLYSELSKIIFSTYGFTGKDEIEDDVVVALEIDYRVADKYVIVRSVRMLESVVIYNTQGELMAHLNPKAEMIACSIADYPVGIYIVCVYDGETLQTKKIIKY